MRLTADNTKANIIRSYSPGQIHMRDEIIGNHAIISADLIIRDWTPAALAELSINDFQPALDLRPDIILFGTGEKQHFPELRVLTEIMRTGVAIEVMTTHAACRTYNVLLSENRAVVAALLID